MPCPPGPISSSARRPTVQPVWLLDLDGVVWLADEPIDGSAQAISELRDLGVRVVFVTNNSSLTLVEYVEKLARHHIEASPEDMITSSQAAASLVERGQRTLACGGPGVIEALVQRGAQVFQPGDDFDPEELDAVVVGWDRRFDFDRLAATATAARACGRLIGTNDDATYPISGGLLPGAGAVLAAVAKASGLEPVVAGKPYQPMASLVGERLGPVGFMVGDRPSTDGRMAQRLKCRFGLVDSGVTRAGSQPVGPPPDERAADLRSFVHLMAAKGPLR
ncbi:MAG: HAD-IIA family hydrolase [Acidimicrobiales bacterium]